MSVSKFVRITATGAAIAALAILSVPAFAKSAATSQVPGRALSQRSLYNLYAGKSWFWKDGVAYFGRNGRFYAWSGSGRKATYVNGGWGAYKNGKICFSGTWRSADGDGFNSTCFLHKKAGGNILQMKQPVGSWYTFKHARTKKNDEYKKVVPGDYASSKSKSLARGAPSKEIRTYAQTYWKPW